MIITSIIAGTVIGPNDTIITTTTPKTTSSIPSTSTEVSTDTTMATTTSSPLTDFCSRIEIVENEKCVPSEFTRKTLGLNYPVKAVRCHEDVLYVYSADKLSAFYLDREINEAKSLPNSDKNIDSIDGVEAEAEFLSMEIVDNELFILISTCKPGSADQIFNYSKSVDGSMKLTHITEVPIFESFSRSSDCPLTASSGKTYAVAYESSDTNGLLEVYLYEDGFQLGFEDQTWKRFEIKVTRSFIKRHIAIDEESIFVATGNDTAINNNNISKNYLSRFNFTDEKIDDGFQTPVQNIAIYNDYLIIVTGLFGTSF